MPVSTSWHRVGEETVRIWAPAVARTGGGGGGGEARVAGPELVAVDGLPGGQLLRRPRQLPVQVRVRLHLIDRLLQPVLVLRYAGPVSAGNHNFGQHLALTDDHAVYSPQSCKYGRYPEEASMVDARLPAVQTTFESCAVPLKPL